MIRKCFQRAITVSMVSTESRLMVKPRHVKSVTTHGYHFWDRGKPCTFNDLQTPGWVGQSHFVLAFVPQINKGHLIAAHAPCHVVWLQKFLRPANAFLKIVVIKLLTICQCCVFKHRRTNRRRELCRLFVAAGALVFSVRGSKPRCAPFWCFYVWKVGANAP